MQNRNHNECYKTEELLHVCLINYLNDLLPALLLSHLSLKLKQKLKFKKGNKVKSFFLNAGKSSFDHHHK